MKRLEHLFVLLNGWALIAMLGAMTLIVGANIGLRYVTGQSLSWARARRNNELLEEECAAARPAPALPRA